MVRSGFKTAKKKDVKTMANATTTTGSTQGVPQ